MSVSSVASSCMGAYQSQSAKPAAVASNTPVTSDDEAQKKVKSGCNRHGGGQQNTLAKAMMAALKSLGVGQSAATTAAAVPTTAVKTTDTTEKATAVDSGTESRNIEKAVHEFAHELFQALRGRGNSEQEQGQGNGHEHGHEHGHGHHGHRSEHGGGYGRGYGDLAQRIGQLAQTLGAPAGSSTASTAAAATPVATSTAAVPATAATTTATSTDAATTSTTTPVASATPATPAVSGKPPARRLHQVVCRAATQNHPCCRCPGRHPCHRHGRQTQAVPADPGAVHETGSRQRTHRRDWLTAQCDSLKTSGISNEVNTTCRPSARPA